jgi:anti-anti-sigma factor
VDIAISSVVDSQARSVVLVSGAIDLASRAEVLDAGRAALARDGSAGLVLELSGVDFIDSTGIGVIVELAGDAADLGRSFLIRRPSPRVVRILEVTGLAGEWDIETAEAPTA